MKKLLASVILAAATPLYATFYVFDEYDYTLHNEAGTAVSEATIALGGFAGGFVPDASNVSEWSTWWTGAEGFYIGDGGPMWSALLDLEDNATFAVGQQLYLWVYDSLTGADREWALLSDASWLVDVNGPFVPDQWFFLFGPESEAVFGGIDHRSWQVSTAGLGAASVPDTAGTLMLLGASVGVLAVVRRRLA